MKSSQWNFMSAGGTNNLLLAAKNSLTAIKIFGNKRSKKALRM